MLIKEVLWNLHGDYKRALWKDECKFEVLSGSIPTYLRLTDSILDQLK